MRFLPILILFPFFVQAQKIDPEEFEYPHPNLQNNLEVVDGEQHESAIKVPFWRGIGRIYAGRGKPKAVCPQA